MGLEKLLNNLNRAGNISNKFIWDLMNKYGRRLEEKENIHHSLDALFAKPTNLSYILNLVYLNTYADFKGINSDGFPPKEVMNDPVKYFMANHSPEKTNFSITVMEHTENLAKYLVTWNSIIRTGWKENDLVKAYLYVPKNPKCLTIDVNGYREPTWMFQKKITEDILKKGSAVLYLPAPFHMERCPKNALNGALMINYAMPRNTGFAQFPMDVLTALHHLSDPEQNNVMGERDTIDVSYIGTSLGAIMGLWTYLKILEHNKNSPENEKFKTFESFTSIIGGVNVPEIIEESALFKDFHQLINPTNKTLINGYDPGSIIPNIDLPVKNIFAVIARYDTVVPTKFQEQMINSLGVCRGHTVWLPIGHGDIFLQHKEVGPLITGAVMPYDKYV